MIEEIKKIKRCKHDALIDSPPVFLDNNQLEAIKIAAKDFQLHERIVLELLISTECSVSQLTRLNRSDIDINNRIAWLTYEGGGRIPLEISESCVSLIKEYNKTRSDDKAALLLDKNGERIGIDRINNIVERIGNKAGVGFRLTPDMLSTYWFFRTLLHRSIDCVLPKVNITLSHLQNLPRES